MCVIISTRMIDRNFATLAMLVAMFLDVAVLTILVSLCGVKAESPLVNTLATGAVGIGGAIAGLAFPKSDKSPLEPLENGQKCPDCDGWGEVDAPEAE